MSFSLHFVMTFLIVVSVIGCGSSGGDGDGASGDVVDAPASLTARSFSGTVTSHSGQYASRGTFEISFATSTYAIEGDLLVVGGSTGTYVYTAEGSIGTASMDDNRVSDSIALAMTYTSSSRGTFFVEGPGGSQTGIFREL